jgi:hypothetical protein
MRPAPLALAALIGAAVLAGESKPTPQPKAKGKAKAASKPAVPSFTLPSMGEVPKADGLVRPKVQTERLSESQAIRAADARYDVVKVEFAKAFVRGPQGQVPVAPFQSVALRGDPPTTEKFSSLVRVRSAQRLNAPLQMVILDPRGDTAMTAQGELAFKGATSDEVEYTVDWDPTPLRSGGRYQVLIRIAGEPKGTWPLSIEQKP